MLKKFTHFLLLSVLLLSIGGCSKEELKESANLPVSPTSETDAANPKGKFVREKCPLTVPDQIERPEASEKETVSFEAYFGEESATENGIFMFHYTFTDKNYVNVKDDYLFYHYRDQQWVPAEESLPLVKAVHALAAENTPEAVYLYQGTDEKKKLYFFKLQRGLTPGSMEYTLLSCEGEKSRLTLPVQDLPGYKKDKSAFSLLLAAKDKLYLRMQTEEGIHLLCYDNASNLLFQIPFPGGLSYASIVSIPNQIVVYDAESENNALIFLDDKTGKELSRMDLSNLQASADGDIAADSEGNLYFANSLGIASLKYGSDTWEQIAEKDVTPMTNERLFLSLINSSTFLISSYQGDYLYFYNPDVQIEHELTIFSMPDTNTNYHQSTLEYAALKYMDQNPNVSIHLEIPKIGGMTSNTDIIKALNTRLLAGEGEDILMLDDLPYKALIEKGLLLDIRDVADSYSLFPAGITQPFEKDQAIYAIPARNRLPLLQGQSKDFKDISDLSSLVEACRRFAKEDPDKRPFFLMGASQLAEKFYPVCAPAWISPEGTFDTALFSEFLTGMQELSSLGKEEYADLAKINNWVWDTQVFFDMPDIAEHPFRFYMTDLDVMMHFVAANGYLKYIQSPDDPGTQAASLPRPGQIQNAYFPSRIMSINKNSKNAGEAKKFIHFVLNNQEIQTGELFDGLPIQEQFLKTLLQDQTEARGGMMADGQRISFDTINDEEINGLLAQYGNLDTPVVTDNVLSDIIMKEAEEYFNGGSTLEAAVKAAEQKVNLYLNE